jgi:transcriptional regulator with XRE-family HTH domain
MRQFASLAGISIRTLADRARLREPSDRVLDAIAAALQVSADTLYEQAGMTVDEGRDQRVEQAVREDAPDRTSAPGALEVYRPSRACAPSAALASPQS